MNYYPVVIPTLCRYEHLRNCVESLARCKFADRTELIIGLDYPSKDSHRQGYEKIKAWLPQITGFSKVTVIERPENYGAIRNIRTLREYAFERYDAIIISEDDNVFAPAFLQFMDSALTNFASNQDIISVAGYRAESMYRNNCDYVLTYDSSAWGMGIWRNDVKPFQDISLDYAGNVLKSWRKSWKLWSRFPSCLSMLMFMHANGEIYGDTLRSTQNILKANYQIKPIKSLVRNMGHDGSGIHCVANEDKYGRQELFDGTEYYLTERSKYHKDRWSTLFFYCLHPSKAHALLSSVRIFFNYIIYRNRLSK